jgi:MFS family permease
MENSSPLPQEKARKEPIFFGILAGGIYAIPPIAFFVLVVPYFALFLSFSFWGGEVNEQLFLLLFIITIAIAVIIVALIAFFTGRAAYKSVNESGSLWNTAIGMLVSVIVFFVGAFVFSASSIFILDYFYGGHQGDELGVFMIGIVLGVFVAYIVALLSGGLTLKILGRRSATLEKNQKIEEGS